MPLPKPHKGESKDDFMARCMHEAYGDNAPDDRTQEQAIAMCMQAWRDKDKAMKTKQEGDPPDPEEDEAYEEFMDRCIEEVGGDEDDAAEVCQLAWDEADPDAKRLPNGTLFRTHAEEVKDNIFVLSDETVDRMGEIISAKGWDLSNFRSNPIALFSHRADQPIGTWSDLAVKGDKLMGKLNLAPFGTSPRIDELRKLVDAGILRAVSVGFRPSKKEPIDEKADQYFGPFRYLEQELVECSLVSVPANPKALAVAKSLKISPETIDAVFAGSGRQDSVVRRRAIGRSARTNDRNRRSGAMSLAQRITEVQANLVAKRDELAKHLDSMDDTNVSETDLQKIHDLNADIAQLDKTHTMLVESEKNLAGMLDDHANGKGNGKLPVIYAQTTVKAQTTKERVTTVMERPITSTIGKKELDLLDLMVRGATIAYVAKIRGHDVHRARVDIYGDDEPTKFVTELITRAASAPAMTTVTGWAAELVQQTWVAMMPLLMPNAILTRLAARGLSLTFGRAGKINIPTRSRTPTIAGSFVGEGQAIPVRQGAFTSQSLTPKKMAVITTWTREMDEHSIPAIEGILREAIQEDTSVATDSVLIDANAATLIRPAGLLNGVAAITATAITNGALAAIIGDIKSLLGALTTSLYGNVRSPVFLMNPTDLLSAGLIVAPQTGTFPFRDQIAAGNLAGIGIIDSATVPAKTMILVDAADFVVADGGAPRFEISDQATLHMEDTNPADLVGGSPAVTASPQRSLFQTDSLALRMVMPLNWLQRRAGTVAWTQNVTWS